MPLPVDQCMVSLCLLHPSLSLQAKAAVDAVKRDSAQLNKQLQDIAAAQETATAQLEELKRQIDVAEVIEATTSAIATTAGQGSALLRYHLI